ncbi:hypothetical protein ABPG72_009822 [Tetrahymena utriculariae]
MNKVSPHLVDLLVNLTQNSFFLSIYDKMLKSCFINLLEEDNNLKVINQLQSAAQSDEERDTINETFNVLILTIAEFNRKNLVQLEIDIVLKEVGFSDDMISKFQQRYSQFIEFISDKDNERSNFFDSSINFNKLVDVEWKQEYVLSTKYIKHLNKDNYHISLSTLNSENQISPINFKCSIEQLTELVHKLSSAVRNIEQATDLRHFKAQE